MPKTLVFGAAGMLGSQFVRSFAPLAESAGWALRAFVRPSQHDAERFSDFLGVEEFTGDYADPDDVENALGGVSRVFIELNSTHSLIGEAVSAILDSAAQLAKHPTVERACVEVIDSAVLEAVEQAVRLFTPVVLTDEDYLWVLGHAAGVGARSGRIYDALILKCGERSGVDVVYTWNTTHFLSVAWASMAGRIRTRLTGLAVTGSSPSHRKARPARRGALRSELALDDVSALDGCVQAISDFGQSDRSPSGGSRAQHPTRDDGHARRTPGG